MKKILILIIIFILLLFLYLVFGDKIGSKEAGLYDKAGPNGKLIKIDGLKVSESDLFYEKDGFIYYVAGGWSDDQKLDNVDAKTFKIIKEDCKIIEDKNSIYRIEEIDDSPPGESCIWDPCFHYEAVDYKVKPEDIEYFDGCKIIKKN